MKYDMSDLAYYAGTQEYAQLSAPSSTTRFDVIKLGTDGRFYLTRYSQGKDQTGYQIVDLSGAFKTTIVRIRRKMVAYDMNEVSIASHEYDKRGEPVSLSTDETLTEKQAKEKYPNIKVRLVLYLALPTGVAKLEVSGGSLYHDTDTDLRLYNYLQSYGADEHCFSATTYVKSKKISDETRGDYHNMVFSRGEAHNEEMLDKVGDIIIALKLTLDEYDAESRKFNPIFKKKENAAATALLVDENINYKDIPF